MAYPAPSLTGRIVASRAAYENQRSNHRAGTGIGCRAVGGGFISPQRHRETSSAIVTSRAMAIRSILQIWVLSRLSGL